MPNGCSTSTGWRSEHCHERFGGAPDKACVALPSIVRKFTKVEGNIPVMLTPFTDQGEIDYPGLERLIEWYSKRGGREWHEDKAVWDVFLPRRVRGIAPNAPYLRAIGGIGSIGFTSINANTKIRSG